MCRALLLLTAAAAAADTSTTYNYFAILPYTALDFFAVEFEVGPGVAEIEVAHLRTDSSTTNILDWGLASPSEVVGWGGGLTDPATVGVNATSRGYQLLPSSLSPDGSPTLAPGNWSVLVGKPRIQSGPGSYSINVTLRSVPTLPPQTVRTPYVQAAPLDIPVCPGSPPTSSSSCLAWYAGDFHVHSRESGDAYANATADEVAAFAASQGLDFVHFSDHNTPALSSFLVDAQSRHGQGSTTPVLLLPGVEFTTYHGHAGALFTTSFVDFRMGNPSGGPTPGVVSIEGAVQAVHAQGGLFSINHMDVYTPSSDPDGDEVNSCVGCYWGYGGALPTPLLDAMEVGIQSYAGLIPVGQVASPLAIQYWDATHALGYTHVAPISGSDDHHGGQDDGAGLRGQHAAERAARALRAGAVPSPRTLANGHQLTSAVGSPATMVLAANLSHAAVREGVALGRTVVKMWHAMDWMVDLWACTVSARRLRAGREGASQGCTGSVARVGSTVETNGAGEVVLLSATVTLPPGPATVRPGAAPTGSFCLALVRNNEQWFRVNVTAGTPFSYNVTVPLPEGGVDRWRAEVHEATTGLLHTITNHIFLPAPARGVQSDC